MKQIEDFDDAIYKTLFAYGNQTYNNLYRKTQEFRKCPVKTFDKHLKDLVSDQLIIRTEIPKKQLVEYSINQDVSEPAQDIIRMLEQVTKGTKKLFDVIIRFFKKHADFYKDYRNFVDRDTGALDLCVECILSSYYTAAWCSFFLSTSVMAKLQEKRVKQLQKISFEMAQKIFQTVKSLNFEAFMKLFQFVHYKMASNLNLGALVSS